MKMKNNFHRFRRWVSQPYVLLIIVIITWGAALRIYALDYDHWLNFHPDAINITETVRNMIENHTINPNFYTYNNFIIYLIFALSLVFKALNVFPHEYYEKYLYVVIAARMITILFSIAALPLFYKILRFFLSRNWSIFGLAMFSFCWGFIKYAKYGTAESIIVFSLLLTIYFVCRHKIIQSYDYLLAGIAIGIGFGTKTTAISFLLIPILRLVCEFKPQYWSKSIRNFALLVFAVIGVFFITSPFSFFYWQDFIRSNNFELAIVKGNLKAWYTIQFLNDVPLANFINNLFWYLTPVPVVLGILGTIWGIIHTWKYKALQHIPLLGYVVFYFVYVGTAPTQFSRYALLIIPILIIYGIIFISRIKHLSLELAVTLSFVSMLSIVFVSASFLSISTINSRQIAMDFIETTMRPHENWVVEDFNNDQFYKLSTEQFTYLNPYFDENGVMPVSTEVLAKADYFIIASDLNYVNAVKAQQYYPNMNHFYQLLFNYQLGFYKIYDYQAQPFILSNIADPQKAFLDQRYYDWPHFMIFKSLHKYSAKDLENLIKADQESRLPEFGDNYRGPTDIRVYEKI